MSGPNHERGDYAVISAEQQAVFVSNIEALVAGEDGRVTGTIAEVVSGLSARALWMAGVNGEHYGTVVLPEQPSADFVDYVGSFGVQPSIIVPKGIDPTNLSIRDGFADVALSSAINGRVVESFMPDSDLYYKVESRGGTYVGGNPKRSTQHANDKGAFAHLAQGIVQTPQGLTYDRLDAIVEAAQRQLDTTGAVSIRRCRGAGGLANVFLTGDNLSAAEIRQKILQKDGDWEDEPTLVEAFIPDLEHFPSISYGLQGFAFDALTLSRDKSFVGGISPTPRSILSARQLRSTGEAFATRIQQETGHRTYGNLDMAISKQGVVYGMESNARMTGMRHAIAIGELLLGPWKHWRKNSQAILTLDVKLCDNLDFSEVHAILKENDTLAHPDQPYGVVISRPPCHGQVGIQIQQPGYKQLGTTLQKVIGLIGHPDKNWLDNPYSLLTS